MKLNDSKRLFTPEEEKFILNNYGPMTARQIAAEIGQPLPMVREFVKKYDENRGAR